MEWRWLLGSLVVGLVACSSDDGAAGPSGSGSGAPPCDRCAADGGPSGADGSSDARTSSEGGDTTPKTGSGGTGGPIGASVTLAGCTGCRVHTPAGYAPGKATPLLLALHGDEGPDVGVPNVIQLWTSAADAHGFLVLAVACSTDLGCNDGNWSNWLANQGYQISAANMTKLESYADVMESLYDVDTKREYLGGYSGGAYVLGYFAQARAERYAGTAFVAGGMPAWTGTGHACPTKKIPGYFLGGDKDPRTGGQMSDTASSFDACGQEHFLDLVTNADHQQTIATLGTGRADAILAWFASRPLK